METSALFIKEAKYFGPFSKNMKPLITLSDKDIFPNAVVTEVGLWANRSTVKIILQNERGEIALVTNPVHGCYLLPGGGMDEGETVDMAADRECREEVGYAIKDSVEIGFTEEFRARDGKHYVTRGVVATVGAPTGEDARTENEKALGLNVIWRTVREAHDIFVDQNRRLVEGKIDFYNTGFNIVRDGVLLDEAIRKWLIKPQKS